MITFLSENLATILVSLVLVGIVAAVIVKMRKDKKAGVSSCGGNCQNCPSACHNHKK